MVITIVVTQVTMRKLHGYAKILSKSYIYFRELFQRGELWKSEGVISQFKNMINNNNY